jgi:TPR repeat protein
MKHYMFKYFISILIVVFSFGTVSIADDTKEPDFVIAADAFQEGDYVDAAVRFGNLAVNGNAAAQYNYAMLVYKGVGAPSDFEEAWYWSWMARLAGIEKAVELTGQIAGELGLEHEEILLRRLRNTFEKDALQGDANALSNMAIFLTEAQTDPDLAEGYVWALVAQALGQTDVQHIVKKANDELELSVKIESQKKANSIFEDFQ